MHIFLVVLAFVLSLFRLMALGIYSAVVPEATTNLIVNPSIGLATTGYTGDSSTIVRSGARARFGGSSLNVTPTSAATAGMYYAITLSTTTTYTLSFWIYSNAGVTYRTYAHDVTAGATLGSITSITGSASWQLVTHTFTTGANSSIRLYIGKASGSSTANFYVDGVQLEAKSYATTYCDGDQPGCLWNGTRHGSTSSRSVASRAGGRVWDLEDLDIYLLDHGGGGMPPVSNITSDYGLLPGSTYQRSKVLARLLTLTLDQDDSQAADAFQALHDVRRSLIELFDPYGVEGSQPTILRYTGGSEPLEIDVFYDAGLEGGSTTGFIETATLRLLAPNPFWRQVGNQAKALSVNETFADADRIVQRTKDGLWQALLGGLSGTVRAAVYGPDGNLYVGGAFTTAYNAAGTGSALTVNLVAKWDGAVWSALGSGLTGSQVLALAFDAAGNLYAGGDFTDAAYPYLAKWDGSTWSAVGGTGGTNQVSAIAVGTNGDVYIGGSFTNWDGIAAADYIAKWDGSAWSALGSGLNNVVTALAVAPSGNVYVGGSFTLTGATPLERIARWTPANSTYAPLGTSRWDEVGGGLDNGGIGAIAIGPDNTIYVGGSFTATANHPAYITRTGTIGTTGQAAWLPLGSTTALNNTVWDLHFDTEGGLLVGGFFTTVMGLTYPDRVARWTPGGWHGLWIDLPGSAEVYSIATYPDGPINPDTGRPRTGRMALGFNTSGTATSSNISDHTITNNGSAPTAPIIRITGPCVLETFVNMTTGRRIDFNGQQLQAGEVATLDLRPGQLSFTTTFNRNLLNTILSSHPTSFRLLRGDNTILVKLSGTTAASGISVMWSELHWSYDV